MACGESTKVCGPPSAKQSFLLTSTVDYILFIQAKVDLNINPNEVQAYKYVNADELKEMFKDARLSFTPWFKLICNTMLFEWWSNLNNLDAFTNDTQIRRM